MAVLTNVSAGRSVNTATSPGVGVSPAVIGRKMGPTGLGATSASICFARATAVLFILINDRSCELRACRSLAVGGVGLILATTNIIHAIPEQRNSAANPWRGATNLFINKGRRFRQGGSHTEVNSTIKTRSTVS